MTIRLDFSDLFDNLDLEDDLTEEFVDDVRTKLAADLMAGLQLATPVDTGQARNGWNLDEAGEQTVIENRVPYIGRLNDGHSKQAPAGFVEAVIDDVAGRSE